MQIFGSCLVIAPATRAPTKQLFFFERIAISDMAESTNEEYQHGKPTEGMCCLCTMEDITEEDQNYGEKKKERERLWMQMIISLFDNS